MFAPPPRMMTTTDILSALRSLIFCHHLLSPVISLSRTLTPDKRFDFDPRKSSFMAKIDATAIKNWFLTLQLCCSAHL